MTQGDEGPARSAHARATDVSCGSQPQAVRRLGNWRRRIERAIGDGLTRAALHKRCGTGGTVGLNNLQGFQAVFYRQSNDRLVILSIPRLLKASRAEGVVHRRQRE